MSLIAPLLCLFLTVQLGERRAGTKIVIDDRVPDETSLVHRDPSDLHLSTFSTPLCAKLGTDGSFDTGAGVLRFFKRAPAQAEGEAEASAWVPLDVQRLRFGRGPELWGTYFDKFDGGFVNFRGAVMEVGAAADRRLQLAVQIAFENPSNQARHLRLRAELSPGGEPGVMRPLPMLDLDAETTFGQDGQYLTRDGTAMFQVGAGGLQPSIVVASEVAGPGDAVAVLEWSVGLSAGESLVSMLHLAGPPQGPGSQGDDEDAWRAAFDRFTYDRIEEAANWQSDIRPTYIANRLGDLRLTRAMLASIHTLRSLGHGDQILYKLTDRPFNRPASDAAVEGMMVGSMMEWGLLAFVKERMDELVVTARMRVAHLSAERRVAYLDGLVRSARLVEIYDHDAELAEVILELVEAGTPVPPWSDPEEVTAAFRFIVERAGFFERVDEVPELSWAAPPAGSLAAHAVAVRKSLAASDPLAAWKAMQPILDSTSIDGMGSMQVGAAFDGIFPVMLMTLVRAILLDDFGEDLLIAPGLVAELLPYSGRMKLVALRSSYGLVSANYYWSLMNRVFSGQAKLMPWAGPKRVLLHSPRPYVIKNLRMVVGGGDLKVLPDGTMEFDYEPFQSVEFNATVRKAPR